MNQDNDMPVLFIIFYEGEAVNPKPTSCHFEELETPLQDGGTVHARFALIVLELVPQLHHPVLDLEDLRVKTRCT